LAVKPRSRRQEQTLAAQKLRAQGWNWSQVAAELCGRYHVNPRVAHRLARGWSQREAADAWNARWPDDLKTFKNFSTWELWPGPTGHAPSLATLDRLAQLYECAVTDLLTDMPDYGPKPETAPSGLLTAAGSNPGNPAPLTLVPALADTLTRFAADINYVELAEEVVMWVQGVPGEMNRRELLQKISTTLTVAAAAPLFDMADSDGRERAAAVLDDPQRIDAVTIAQAERGLKSFRMQGDLLGPQVVLPAALAQRKIIGEFATHAPSQLRPQVLSLYAELSQLVGWELFDIGDYRAAQSYFDDARTTAHDAENVELVTYVLCNMSQVATWQGKPRVGIDHAIAAQAWATQSGSHMARAYSADVAAKAFAAAGDGSKARAALETERTAAADSRSSGEPLATWWYFYDESFYWGTRSKVSLDLRNPDDAIHAATTALPLSDPANARDYTHRLTRLAEARVQQGEIHEASQVITEAARMTTVNRSPRLEQSIRDVRSSLSPWQRTKSVRRLDEALREYGVGSIEA
jgi:tetratricopeptide (TPR) repeat protein